MSKETFRVGFTSSGIQEVCRWNGATPCPRHKVHNDIPLSYGFRAFLPVEYNDVDYMTGVTPQEYMEAAETIIFDTPQCQVCMEKGSLVLNKAQYDKWSKGALIQDAFPEMSPAHREQLKTGFHPDCWKQIFG